MKKNIAVISVRFNSKRFPGKALKRYKNKNTLDRIFDSLKKIQLIDEIIVATTTSSADKKIYNYCKKKKYPCHRGSELNLIKRFYDATKRFKPEILIRITGDNPFTSSEITDFMIKKHLSAKSEFTYMNKKNLPVGVCPEIINFKALEKLQNQKINFNYSEYMMYYFINNAKFFKVRKVNPLKKFKTKLKNLRLTLDYKQDFYFLKEVINLLSKHNMPTNLKNIYKIIKENPLLHQINKKILPKIKTNSALVKKIKVASKIKYIV